MTTDYIRKNLAHHLRSSAIAWTFSHFSLALALETFLFSGLSYKKGHSLQWAIKFINERCRAQFFDRSDIFSEQFSKSPSTFLSY